MRARKRPYLSILDRSLELFARLRPPSWIFKMSRLLSRVGDLYLLYLWDGPVADLQSIYNVTVPESPMNLTDEQVQQIARALKEAGDQDGLIAFLVILEYLQVS